jgi:hypothetical protein
MAIMNVEDTKRTRANLVHLLNESLNVLETGSHQQVHNGTLHVHFEITVIFILISVRTCRRS